MVIAARKILVERTLPNPPKMPEVVVTIELTWFCAIACIFYLCLQCYGEVIWWNPLNGRNGKKLACIGMFGRLWEYSDVNNYKKRYYELSLLIL